MPFLRDKFFLGGVGATIALVLTTGLSSAAYAVELSWAGEIYPGAAAIRQGSPISCFAKVRGERLTDRPGQGKGISGRLILSRDGVRILAIPMTYTIDVGERDEYRARISGLATGRYEIHAEFQKGSEILSTRGVPGGVGFLSVGGAGDSTDEENAAESERVNVEEEVEAASPSLAPPSGRNAGRAAQRASSERPSPSPERPSPITWTGEIYPPQAEIPTGEPISFFAKVYGRGLTDRPGQGKGVVARLVVMQSGFRVLTLAMEFTNDVGPKDEYRARIASLPPGRYEITAEFEMDRRVLSTKGLPEGEGILYVGAPAPAAVPTSPDVAPIFALAPPPAGELDEDGGPPADAPPAEVGVGVISIVFPSSSTSVLLEKRTDPSAARVLLWWNRPDGATFPAVEASLSGTSSLLETTVSLGSFRDALRRNHHNLFLILGNASSLDERTGRELSEHVRSGAGLVAAGLARIDAPKGENLLGGTALGNLGGTLAVWILPGPLSEFGETLLATGPALCVGSVVGETLAIFDTDGCATATRRSYGLGRALYLDLAAADAAPGLLPRALESVRPVAERLVAGGAAAIEISVGSEAAEHLAVDEILPVDFTVVSTPGATASGQALSWSVSLGPNETRRMEYLARLPKAGGIIRTEATAYRTVDGFFVEAARRTLEFEAQDAAASIAEALEGLGALVREVGAEANDLARIGRATAILNTLRTAPPATAAEHEAAIATLCNAIDEIVSVSGGSAARREAIRIAIGSALRTYEVGISGI